MTAPDDQPLAHSIDRADSPTLARHRQGHDATPDFPDAAIAPQQLPHQPPGTVATEIGANPHFSTQRLAAYIRHVADSAPAPTPAQLERLAGLLRNIRDTSSSR